MTWYLKPYGLPKPKINRDYTRLIWNGKHYAPGTYNILKGTSITASISIKNEGDPGKVRVVIWDSYENKAIFSRDMDMSAGQSTDVSHTFTMDRNYAIKIITYYLDPADNTYKKYDEYG